MADQRPGRVERQRPEPEHVVVRRGPAPARPGPQQRRPPGRDDLAAPAVVGEQALERVEHQRIGGVGVVEHDHRGPPQAGGERARRRHAHGAGRGDQPATVAAAFLGLGPDGHVASLFPGRPEAANPTLTSAFVPETPPHAHARLTLGPAALGALPCIVLVAEGAEKRAVLARAMAPDADPAALPLAWIARLPQTSVFQDRP